MRLSLQQKEQFFYELSSGLLAGQPFREVLERSSKRRSRAKSQVARAILAANGTGDGSAAAAFEAVPEVIDALDLSMVQAGEASGRLDAVCKSLSEYYGLLAKAKRAMLSQIAYPVFLLHFGILVLSAPTAFSDGVDVYLREVGTALGILYAVAAILGTGVFLVLRALKTSAWLERIIRFVPLLGGIRQALVGTRFSMVLSMQINAGAGILAGFQRAGDASGSALFRVGAGRVIAMVRSGEPLPIAVTEAGCFPEEIQEAVQTAEANGRLDAEMVRVAAVFQERFTSRLDALAAWFPRIIYIAVVIFVAFKIIEVAKGYFATVEQLLQ